MTTFWGSGNPSSANSGSAVEGDIFISAGPPPDQRRRNNVPFTGGSWTLYWNVIVPPDTRGDVVPSGGQLNDRIAKVGDSEWQVDWANAADGVVTQIEQSSEQLVWTLEHKLSSLFVDVEVVSPGNTDPTAEQIIEVPTVKFINEMICEVTFVEPVKGTAIVRR